MLLAAAELQGSSGQVSISGVDPVLIGGWFAPLQNQWFHPDEQGDHDGGTCTQNTERDNDDHR